MEVGSGLLGGVGEGVRGWGGGGGSGRVPLGSLLPEVTLAG